MSHPLTIDVPEEVFRQLEKWAAQTGKTPAVLVREWVSQRVQELETDPLLKWAGAIDSGVTDVAERHDEYIGQALYEELRGDRHE